MTMLNHSRRLAIALAAAGLSAAPAFGQAQAPVGSASDITRQIEARGYTHVHDVEWDDDGYWEADATDGAGKAVDLKVLNDGTITVEPD